MRQKIFSVLNIRPSESKYIFDLLGVQFFIGIAHAYISILAFTLFLKMHIRELPQAYMIIAGSLLLLNVIYEKLEHKFTPLLLLKYVIGGSILVLILLAIGLQVGNPDLFVFLLLIWSTLFYMISGYAFWGLVSILFNVRESKRVFSVVGGGDLPAKLIGYISAGLIISLFSLNGLAWASVITLLIGFFIFNRIIKKDKWDKIKLHSLHQHHKTQVKITKKEVIRFFFRNELIFAISLLAILSYNVFLLIDYTFLVQVKARYESEESLAAFIGTFFAIGRLIAIILKLVFTSRVIERLGLITCLFITPLMLLMMCVGFFMIIDSSHYYLYLFGIMAMLTEVLRSAMQEPVFFILFQPLNEQQRLKGHIISKGYMLPFSLLTVGSTLYFLFFFGYELSISLTVKIIMVNIAIWSLILFMIRTAYKRTLHSSIRKGIFSSEDVFHFDQKSTVLLLEKVQAGKASEVIYSLRLLENADYPSIDQIMFSQLNHSSHDVRIYILERLSVRGKVDIEVLSKLYEHETNLQVKQKAYELLTKYHSQFLDQQLLRIPSLTPEFKKILIANLLNRREFYFMKTGVEEMNRLLNSEQSDDKLLALEVISEIRNLRFTDELKKLIEDPDHSIRRQALLSACKLKSAQLLPSVLHLLDHPSEKYLAQKGLAIYGDDLFIDIVSIPKADLNRYLPELVKVAGKVKGLHSNAFLLDQLVLRGVSPDRIIQSLWLKEYESPDRNKKGILLDILKQYMSRATEKINYYFSCSDQDEQYLLRRSISAEVRSDLLCILRICSMLFERREVNRLIELIDAEKKTKLFNAMEMMDLMIPKRLSIQLNVLFDFLLDPEHMVRKVEKLDSRQLYEEIVFDNQAGFSAWTRAVCIFDSWKHSETSIISRLHGAKFADNSYILEETRKHVLKNVFS